MAEKLTKDSEAQNWNLAQLYQELPEAWLLDAIYYLEQTKVHLEKALANLAELREKLKGEG